METVNQLLAGGGLTVLPLAFIGGVIAGFNPCCLPLFPAAAATCSVTAGQPERRALPRAAAFAFGMGLATGVLGLIAGLVGGTLTGLGGWVGYVVALVPLVMGAHVLGLIRVPLPHRIASHDGGGIWTAFISGLLLSLVLAPCGTPVLATLLSYAALKGSALLGAALLFVYGLGAGVPVMVVGTAAARVTTWSSNGPWRRWIDKATGVALLGVGFFMLWTV